MKVSRMNPLTGKINVMELSVTTGQLNDWQNGELIHNVMPNLTTDEREFLISGHTPESWEQLFNGIEE